MKIHHLSADEALNSLKTSLNGLSADEAARRLSEFGSNQVESIKKENMLLRFLKGFTHFFAVILWIAAGLAFVAEFNQPGGGMATLGFAIIGVIIINGLFSFWQEYRAEQAIQALQKLLPHQAKVVRDGNIIQVPVSELVPGDIIIFEDGDNVPADCRIIESFGVRVNNATITGESRPKARDAEPSTEEWAIQSKNIALAGTSIVSGQGKAIVFATGGHTEFGKIAHLTQTSGEDLSPLQKEIIFLSRIIAAFSLFLGVLFFFIGRSLGLPFWENFIFAIGIIVANVPEGLLPTVTMALAIGSKRMARKNALIRHLPSVETLGSATVICTDKTGTLTQNSMEVKKIYVYDALHEATDISSLWNIHHLFENMLVCHNLKEIDGSNGRQLSGDPMEIALVDMAKKVVPPGFSLRKIDEVPFEADRKRMSILIQDKENKLTLYTKGALETVLPLCTHIQINNSIKKLTKEVRDKFVEQHGAMAESGLRMLAFAYRDIEDVHDKDALETNLILSGIVGLEDPPRPEVPDAIKKCREAGIKVIMITGDNPLTARAIGRQVGLIKTKNPVVITGTELSKLSNSQLQLALDAQEILFARVAADQKMRIVTALQRKKEIVAVTGDGVNDAPALKKADIGIAMGIAGTDVAREAADMVLMDDNFASIVAAIEEGRAVFTNIQKFLTYILTHNVAELIPYLAFVLFRIPLPLTVIQILAIDLGTDTIPALALGAEKPDPALMKQPPRSSREKLINLPLMLRSYFWLGLIEAIAAMSAFFFVLYNGGWHYGEALPNNNLLYLQATTATLTAIIIMQVVNVFICRSDIKSIFSTNLFRNKLILWGILSETILILLIDYTPIGNAIFNTSPIPVQVWLFVIPFALAMLVLEEIRKFVVRKTAKV
jgi:calcium-translocating P-type ATPase